MASVVMTEDQRVKVSATPLTQSSQPGPIQGDINWASSDELVFRIIAATPGNTQVYLVAGQPGTATGSVSVQPLDTTKQPVTQSFDVQVVPGDTTRLELVFGLPEPK